MKKKYENKQDNYWIVLKIEYNNLIFSLHGITLPQ